MPETSESPATTSHFASGVRTISAWLSLLLVGCLFLVPMLVVAGGTWTPLTTALPSGLQHGLLMIEGTVICANGGTGWHRLTPDNHGSYVNGNWNQIAQ